MPFFKKLPELFHLESDNPIKFSAILTPIMLLTEKNCFRKIMSTFSRKS